ncbi:hypothetical protein ACFL6Y_05215 [Elusimicrobiota bacterium]
MKSLRKKKPIKIENGRMVMLPFGVGILALIVGVYYCVFLYTNIGDASLYALILKWFIYFAVFDVCVYMWHLTGLGFPFDASADLKVRLNALTSLAWHKWCLLAWSVISPLVILNSISIGAATASAFYLGAYYAVFESARAKQ